MKIIRKKKQQIDFFQVNMKSVAPTSYRTWDRWIVSTISRAEQDNIDTPVGSRANPAVLGLV